VKAGAGEWRARLILATLSVSVALVCAEAAARYLLEPRAIRPEGTPISEVSPTLGWKAKAGGAQRIRREDFDVEIAINSLGLRGPEIPYEATNGARRLAIMGDSFAHGYYAEERDTLRGRLGAALGPCGVDVLNAGGPGYSTDQEWLYFDEEIRRYSPAEVVVVFYYNDLQFNIERVGTANRPKPMFVEIDGSLQLIPPDEPRQSRSRDRADRPPARRAAPQFHRSALWAFGASRLAQRRPDWARSLSQYGLTPQMSETPPVEFLPFGPTPGAEARQVDQMWDRTRAILAAFRDGVRAAGAGFSVLYAPSRFEVNDAAWTFVQRRYESDRPWNRGVVRERLTTMLAGLDIPLIDPTEALRAAERESSPAYLPVDGHWNARGNEVAFGAVLPVMRRAFGCGS
jgi:hypothetical protein